MRPKWFVGRFRLPVRGPAELEAGLDERVSEVWYRGTAAAKSLPGTVLRNVEFRRCPECGSEAVANPAIEQLDETLASEVVRKPAPLSSDEFRFLRKYLGWSGRDTAKRMGVEPETVSRWEHGSRTIGRTADRLLRTCVMLESPVDNYSVSDLEGIQEEGESRALKVERRRHVWELCA